MPCCIAHRHPLFLMSTKKHKHWHKKYCIGIKKLVNVRITPLICDQVSGNSLISRHL
jgi:hypothetical protein